MAGLCVTSVAEREHTVLRLVGELDLAEVGDLRRAAVAAIAAGRGVQVDLGQVSYVDACGLASLVWVRRAAHAAGVECHLVVPSRAVRRVAALTRSEAELGWDLPGHRHQGAVRVRSRRAPGLRDHHPVRPRHA